MYDHIFTDHNLKPIHEYAVFNNSSPLIWPSLILLLCFGLFVFIRVSAFPKLVNTFQSSYSMQAIRQLEREEFNPLNLTSFLLSLLFVLMFSFFLYKVNCEYNVILENKSDLAQYATFVLCMCLFLPIKFGLKKIIGFVSETPALTTELFYNNLVINQSLGLILLPIMAIIEFSRVGVIYVLIATSIIIASSMLIKLYRGLIFSLFENHIGLLQVFIYLCALEILPFLVFIKFIVINF